jgi:hypothetical protein
MRILYQSNTRLFIVMACQRAIYATKDLFKYCAAKQTIGRKPATFKGRANMHLARLLVG